MTTVKKANEQIRRLRAGLQEARDTLRDHFGPDDASVKACDVALVGEPWHPTDPTRNIWPEAAQADTRVDVRFADGDEAPGRRAGQWHWGDARGKTITHWRLSK